MRFNGTTVPTHRDDTYDTTEINRDIQTGRAVYADKDKYENDANYKASIDSYVKEGFHLIFGTPDNPSEGGGASLPEVTTSDNGMVLTVVEGEWDKAAGGGGAEPLIVIDNGGTLNKTYQQIYDAVDTYKTVLVLRDTESVLQVSSTLSVISNDLCIAVAFVKTDGSASTVFNYYATTADDYPMLD